MTRSVALVLDYAPDYLGGAQTAYFEQIALLVSAGHRVSAFAPVSSALTAHCASVGAEHVAITAPVMIPRLGLPWLRNSPGLRRRLRDEFARRNVDVVHVHSELGLSAAAICAGRSLRLPIVHTVHTAFWRGPRRAQKMIAALIRTSHRALTGLRWSPSPHGGSLTDDALRGMTTAAASCADVVVSPSAHQAKILEARLLRPCVVTVPNASRTMQREPLPGHVPLRLLWAARCEPEKRLLEFLDAVALAQHQLGQQRLLVTVAGDGSTLKLAQARELEDVTFLGRVSHERMPKLLAEHHLLVITSDGFDNQPMTVVEAIAAGRGVLVCDPALREGLAHAGRLSGPEPAQLAAAIVDLAREPHTVAELSERAASERAFEPGTVVTQLEEAYRLADRTRQRHSGWTDAQAREFPPPAAVR